ncbi:carbon-nitrogen hydrolase [Stutzerimonas stutzeri]|uniref:Carbon-nitrogen hydrolase n=1 Tax=Stutzerimonas stutzeri TaxID=316 RepID=A0A2N8RJ01_STUST|nr:carbon-nitrogen hydrolase [Stutzerimonas stutzeri]MCQ4252706.1 carbon-nitrogen hydrolase [Stutzerimonas stutzeri]PNF61052.1 carbon-nitrogen hydrolase [Stutzerimonas stutzeri]
MRISLNIVLLLVLAGVSFAVYLDWTGDRRSGPLLSDLRTLPIESQGQAGTAGNLLGIETRLQPADYQSRERLRLKFQTYLRQAEEAGMLSERTIVVLPEHVGTGLFALGEKPEVQQARTLRDAMQWMALSNPGSYLRALTGNQGDDRRTGAVLRLKAQQMAEEYQTIFGGLAKEFGVTLVAGSIVLPEPYLENAHLRIGDGPLRQVSLTFDAHGRALGALQYKQTLSRYERRYSVAPIPEPQRLIETPAGSLAVLLGCDAYLQRPPPEAKLLAIPGALADPQSNCGSTLTNTLAERPHMAVRTLAMPWNLLGSPRRPAPPDHGVPVQIRNLWLDASR